MNKIFKAAILSFVLNAVSLLLLNLEMGFALMIVSIIGQLAMGVVLTTYPEDRKTGQGMLIGLGIFILVGFSVCTIFINS